ncbi:MAG: DivIVA domain-containing protein [Sporichthyaceae bacterium]
MSHHDRFRRAGRLRKGYHRRQVDAFLNHVEVSLSGVFPPPTASEVRQVGFELVRSGYDVEEVDAHLDALEEKVVAAQSMTAGRRGKPDPDSESAYLREQLAASYMQRFPRAGTLRRGYQVDDVDDVVDRVVAALDGQGSLTLEEVRAVAFRPKRGGYREDAVDEAMDRVIEHLLLVRRLGAPEHSEQPHPPAQPAT